jgi:predicted TPR repeat methyltransferase
LKLDPNNVRTLKAMGHVREVQGQTHLALDNYLRVLQIDQQQGMVAQRVASLQSQMAGLPVPNGMGGNPGITSDRYGSVAPYLQR